MMKVIIFTMPMKEKITAAKQGIGYWYWLSYDVNPKIGNWHCSVCNNIPKSLEKEKYCPNCGTKMVVVG